MNALRAAASSGGAAVARGGALFGRVGLHRRLRTLLAGAGILVSRREATSRPPSPKASAPASASALTTLADAAGPFTPREADVLALLAEGMTNNEIAHRLSVSGETVKVHVDAILRKLDVPSRTAAVAVAFRLGLLG